MSTSCQPEISMIPTPHFPRFLGHSGVAVILCTHCIHSTTRHKLVLNKSRAKAETWPKEFSCITGAYSLFMAGFSNLCLKKMRDSYKTWHSDVMPVFLQSLFTVWPLFEGSGMSWQVSPLQLTDHKLRAQPSWPAGLVLFLPRVLITVTAF